MQAKNFDVGREREGKTQMQGVMEFLDQNGYVYYSHANVLTNKLEDLSIAHPKLLEIWHAFPHVLLMDATYKTNKYMMLLLEIVGVTPINMIFSITFVCMHEERQSNYVWALDCLKSVMEGCMLSRVIVTDREMALMNAYMLKDYFADDINNNIMKKCKSSCDVLYTSWTRLVNSETKEAYNKNLAQVEKITNKYPDAFTYLNKTWLTPHKEKFVFAWTDKFLNFDNNTANKAEIHHAKLKRYVETSRLDITKSLKRIHDVVESQYTEYEGSKEFGFVYDNCGCQVCTSYGLPCAHEQAISKLDLLECKSLEDENLGCAVELSLARKLLNLITPSTTSFSEPVTHKITRGRPSLKKKLFKKTHIDLNQDPSTQVPPPNRLKRHQLNIPLDVEPDMHSTYSFRETPMFNSTFNHEQSMHNSYFNQ
uniref:MULE transposase domain-containing protein n=1 Tax=Lactuca sativa TaxID=4236 RepID=A0A9R1WTA1_LACSA|nr:hypothetical protein LSAT_V11C100042500 [Lactuca sativa]